MRKIIILCSVLLIAIAVIAVKYFSELSGNTNSSTKVLKYIPSDAALILSFNNDESFYDIFSDYELFDAIIGETRAAELEQLYNLLLKQPSLKEITGGEKVFLSFHPGKADSVSLLFSMGFNEKASENDIQDYFINLPGVSLTKLSDANWYSLSLNTINKPFFLYIANGAVTGSFSKELLGRAAEPTTGKINKSFISEISENSSRNHNSPVSLFINHGSLPSFFASFMRVKANGNLLLLKDMLGFSALTMNFKSDALMFNGISTPDTAASVYLNLFLGQHPVKNQLKNLLPVNTSNSILFGLSDYKKFHNELKGYLRKKGELSKLDNQLKLIRTETGINIDTDVKPKLSNEFALIETENRERLGIIKVSNGIKMNFTLRLISQQVTETISRLNHSNILYYYLGDPFKSFTRPYFAIADNYLIVANSQSVVQSYLNEYAESKFIVKTKEYTEHDQLVANKSNILFFINNKNSEKIMKATLKRGYAEIFSDDNYALNNFYGLTWQWSSEGKHFQTNLYSNFNTTGKKELKSVWSFKLNARIATTPQIFREGQRQVVIVQDKVYNLYALSDDGKKLWATQLDGKVQGVVCRLNDGSLLFNTSRKLYRMDMKGNSIAGFPVNLPFNATGGLSVTAAEPASAKIFIPAQSMILAYTTAGATISGWNKELPGRIIPDLKLTSNNNINYLITGTQDGRFFFFNYNGQLVGKASVPGKSLFKYQLFVNNDPQNPGVVTTDTSGTAYYIGLNGKISSVNLGKWSDRHSFDFKNVSGDEDQELIYLDKTQLNVYNGDETLAFTYEFEHPVNNLQLFPMHNNQYVLGVSSAEDSQLFLFDTDGNLLRGFPVKGTGNFNVGYLRNDGIQYLLCGTTDNFIHAYKL